MDRAVFTLAVSPESTLSHRDESILLPRRMSRCPRSICARVRSGESFSDLGPDHVMSVAEPWHALFSCHRYAARPHRSLWIRCRGLVRNTHRVNGAEWRDVKSTPVVCPHDCYAAASTLKSPKCLARHPPTVGSSCIARDRKFAKGAQPAVRSRKPGAWSPAARGSGLRAQTVCGTLSVRSRNGSGVAVYDRSDGREL